jgi:hypothetical protein
VLPQTCSQGCAEAFLPWLQECSWETEVGGHPSWLWVGFGTQCSTTLDSLVTECSTSLHWSTALQQGVDSTEAEGGPTVWTMSQQCDGSCDCPGCDDEDVAGCTHPAEFGCSDGSCTCNSGATIPFSWVCDGSDDCGMGEDESLASCGLKGAQSIDVFGASMDASGNSRRCVNRFVDEVEASGCGINGALPNTCDSSCAAAYLPWFMDCKSTVVDAATGNNGLSLALNRQFMCCHSQGISCTGEEQESLVGCDGSSSIESLVELADGECVASLNCGEFGRDGGDCETRTEVRVPYKVSGAVGPDDFADALADGVRWLSNADVEVLEFRQRVAGSIVISSPTVTGIFMSGIASRSQLKNAISTWLHVPEGRVAIGTVEDTELRRQHRRLQREVLHSVRVSFTVTADKDISNPFSSASTEADFRAILNAASPRVLQQLVATQAASNVVVESPDVETEILCDVTVGRTKYEIAVGAQLPDSVDLASEIQLVLLDDDRIMQSLATRCEVNLCATAVQTEPVTIQRIDLGDGKTVASRPPKSKEDTTLVVATVVVGGGAICLCMLYCAVGYACQLKKARKLVVYNHLEEKVGDFDDLANEAQLKVLIQLIGRWKAQEEKKAEADYDAEKKKLVASGHAVTKLDNLLLLPDDAETNDSAKPTQIVESLLIAAIDADHAALAANRAIRHHGAHTRLVSLRTAIAARQRAKLEDAALDADIIEELEEETLAADEDGDDQIAQLVSTLDQNEVQALKAQSEMFASKFVSAKSEVERQLFQDAYNEAMAEERQKMAKARAKECLQLSEKLTARRAALAKTHEESLIDAVLDMREESAVVLKQTELDARLLEAATDEDKAAHQSAFDADIAATQAALEASRAQDSHKLQELLAKMKQKRSAESSDGELNLDENEDAFAQKVLGTIVLAQEERLAAEIDVATGLAAQVLEEQKSVGEARRARLLRARQHLVEARKLLGETEEAALAVAGVPEEMAQAQISEIAAVEIEQDGQREEFETEMDRKEEQQVLAQQSQFALAMEACDNADQEKLAAAYSADLEIVSARVETERAGQRAALSSRLARRKQMLADKQMKALLSAVGDNTEVTRVAEQARLKRLELEAYELTLSTTAPEQAEYIRANSESSSTADDTSLGARRRLAQSRLAELRQEMAERHREEVIRAGVAADSADRHMNELQVNASLADRELEDLEDAAEQEEQKAVANGVGAAQAKAAVAQMRMVKRTDFRAKLRSQREAIEAKQLTEIARVSSTGKTVQCRVKTRQPRA